MPPKLWFWCGAIVLDVLGSTTGLTLDFPNFNQTRRTMQIATAAFERCDPAHARKPRPHRHGYLGMAGAYGAMKTGHVDEEWARDHHEYWYNEIKSGKTGTGTSTAGPTPHPGVA